MNGCGSLCCYVCISLLRLARTEATSELLTLTKYSFIHPTFHQVFIHTSIPPYLPRSIHSSTSHEAFIRLFTHSPIFPSIHLSTYTFTHSIRSIHPFNSIHPTNSSTDPPIRFSIPYDCSETPMHMSAFIDKYNYKLTYPTLFGGVQMMKPDEYEEVNLYV